MDDDRIDLSALDPKADALRFERMVRAVAAAARPPALAAPAVHPLVRDLAGRGRAALAAAALLAVASWLPHLAGGGSSADPAAPAARTAPSAAAGTDPATQLAAWASSGSIPADADVAAILGGPHAR